MQQKLQIVELKFVEKDGELWVKEFDVEIKCMQVMKDELFNIEDLCKFDVEMMQIECDCIVEVECECIKVDLVECQKLLDLVKGVIELQLSKLVLVDVMGEVKLEFIVMMLVEMMQVIQGLVQ